MACWNTLALLLTVFLVADQTFATYNFVVAPILSSGTHLRQRRETQESGNPKVRSLHIDSIIKYRYAHTVVFSKVVNPANSSQEIAFTTVLPDAAFISGFAMTINGTVYKAYVKEKQEAKRIYQEAVSAGQTAGHVELSARDSNTFTVSVNIESRGKVSFNLTYEELLTRERGTYRHKISLNPGQIVKDMKIQVMIHESSDITILKVPQLRESNEIAPDDNSTENTYVSKTQPNSTTAIISWSPSPDQQREINSAGVKGLLEVLYDVDRSSQSNQILVNEGYFVHFFAPANLTPLNKHVVFILDTSGSMYGRKIAQLKEAMTSILDELRSGDSFSLVLFSDEVRVWLTDGSLVDPDNQHGEPLSSLAIAEATSENVQAAKNIVNHADAMGGTHIYDALQTALRVVHQRLENNVDYKEPMIIFLTDGQPNGPNSDSETIIRDITASNAHLSAVIYGLAFGNDADFGLLKKLSLKNSGFARKIYEASDASLQLKNFYSEVSSPILSNVTFSYPEDQVDVASLTKLHFRTHNNGSEIAVAGKLLNNTALTAEVKGQSQSGLLELPMYPSLEVIDYYPRTPVIQNASQAGFMERLWAYVTIQQLLDLIEQTDNATVKEDALRLALKYSFVTPLTSLVVVKPNDTTSAADLQATQAGAPGGPFAFSPRTVSGAPYHGATLHAAYASYPAKKAGLGRGRGTASQASAFGGGAAYMAAGANSWGSYQPSVSLDIAHHQRSMTADDRPYTILPRRRMSMRVDVVTPSPSAGEDLVPLSTYTWFSQISNDTHVSLDIAGVTDTLKIGYNETDVQFNECTVGLVKSHCRHLPHCSLSKFSQDIQIFRNYFCKINDFIGVCCPDHIPLHGTAAG